MNELIGPELSPGLRDALMRVIRGAKRELRGTPRAAPADDAYREDGGEA